MDLDGLWKRAIRREWEGRSVLALSPEDQLQMLCVHGRSHAWSRLIWVCDVAETLRTESVDWEALLLQASDTGSLRMVLLGLRLAEGLCGAPLPESVKRRIDADRVVDGLHAHVLDVLAGREVSAVSEFLFQGKTRDTVAERLGFSVGALFTPTPADFHIGGGRFPTPVYRLIRPLRLARKYWRLRRRPEGWSVRG
jgi:hypothetical protein